jgi:hypothetical protein
LIDRACAKETNTKLVEEGNESRLCLVHNCAKGINYKLVKEGGESRLCYLYKQIFQADRPRLR